MASWCKLAGGQEVVPVDRVQGQKHWDSHFFYDEFCRVSSIYELDQ